MIFSGSEDAAWNAEGDARARQRVDDLLADSPRYYERNALKDIRRCAEIMKANYNRLSDAERYVATSLGIHGDEYRFSVLFLLLTLEYLDAYYGEGETNERPL